MDWVDKLKKSLDKSSLEQCSSSSAKKDEDDTELFNKYFLKWKNAKQKDNPSAAIPRFYYKLPSEEEVLLQKLREDARAAFLQRKSRELLDNDELQNLWYLLDKHQTLPALHDEQMINYKDFIKVKEQTGDKCNKFFTATIFSKLYHNDPFGRISIMQFFNYVMRKVWLHQTRIGLSLYDVTGQGYLRECDLENYILELIPTLPQLEGLEKSFYSFYVCTAVRKFFFFLDPMRKVRDQLEMMKLLYLNSFVIVMSVMVLIKLNNTPPDESGPVAKVVCILAYCGLVCASASSVCKIKIQDILACSFLDDLLELRDEDLSKEQQDSNWFSAPSALRVYGQYLNLDSDHNGMLSKDELQRYGSGTLTKVFIDRVFQECLTYDGEMDYKTYLDFVLALENRKETQSLQYLFRMLDIQSLGYLNNFAFNYFFREIQMEMQKHGHDPVLFHDIQDEIFDMVKPSDPYRITLQDLVNSAQGETVASILIDLNGFWTYENREVLVMQESQGASDV